MQTKSVQWWINVGLFAALVGLLLWLLTGVAGPLLIAWLLAYLLVPLVTWLNTHGIKRDWATLAVFLFGLIGIVLSVILLAPPLITQIVHFIHALPDAVLRLKEQWAPWIQTHLGLDIADEIDRWSLWLRGQAKGLDLESISPWAHWGLSAVSSVFGAILGLFKIILIPLFAFYLLHDWDKIGRMMHDRLPHQSREMVLRLVNEIDAIISAFLRGQFTVCLILAGFYSIGLFIAGIPFALAIGLVSGLLAFIPYVGLITGFCAAALMSLWNFGVDQHLLSVLIVFGVVHMLEAFYLAPKVLGDKLGLHPLVILLALTIAADRFGFAGVLLAVPVTAAGTVLVREIDRRYRNDQDSVSD
ncbi:MAG: AI-2E family transporter [Zetaproteobacteria bacterium]|nr:MAG: AI-2E family transporter [Zetaproteobacteria bacterium]